MHREESCARRVSEPPALCKVDTREVEGGASQDRVKAAPQALPKASVLSHFLCGLGLRLVQAPCHLHTASPELTHQLSLTPAALASLQATTHPPIDSNYQAKSAKRVSLFPPPPTWCHLSLTPRDPWPHGSPALLPTNVPPALKRAQFPAIQTPISSAQPKSRKTAELICTKM